MTIYSIYKITNIISGKCYIGFTKCIYKRWGVHRRRFPNSEYEYEILYQSIEGEHCFKVMEPYFIAEYKSFPDGYNTSASGKGVRKITCITDPNTIRKKHNIIKPTPSILHDCYALT
jgi:hypothetical protein